MARVFSAMPARALRGRPPLAVAPIAGTVFLVLVFGPMLLPLVAFPPSGLLTDWQMRGNALYLRDGTVQGGSCNSRDVLEMCDVVLSAPVGDRQVDRQVSYTFVSASDRPPYRVVADPAHPEWLATDVGLDLFWNRVACFAVGVALLGFLVWVLARAAVRGWRRRRAWRKRDAMAVPLRLVSRQNNRGSQVWTVQGDGAPERWVVPGRAKPFVLGSEWEVLGLQRLDGTGVMPLDSKLRWVRLTKAERALVLGPSKQ